MAIAAVKFFDFLSASIRVPDLGAVCATSYLYGGLLLGVIKKAGV